MYLHFLLLPSSFGSSCLLLFQFPFVGFFQLECCAVFLLFYFVQTMLLIFICLPLESEFPVSRWSCSACACLYIYIFACRIVCMYVYTCIDMCIYIRLYMYTVLFLLVILSFLLLWTYFMLWLKSLNKGHVFYGITCFNGLWALTVCMNSDCV